MTQKYLIYKATGGLSHMIRGLGYAILISKKQNRFLIIDCDTHVGFLHKFSDFFYIDSDIIKYSDNYDDLPNNLTYNNIPVKLIKNTRLSYKNKNYYLNDNNVSKPIQNKEILSIYASYFGSFNLSIKVIPEVRNKIIEIDKESNLNINYISIHFRNTDKKNNLEIFKKKVIYCYNKFKINTIYLATDDYKAYDNLKKSLPNYFKIIQKTKPENFNGMNIHYKTKDKFKLIFNCLLDIYFILKSRIFICSINSGLSKWIIKMINKKKNIFDIKQKKCIII